MISIAVLLPFFQQFVLFALYVSCITYVDVVEINFNINTNVLTMTPNNFYLD